jgi:tRNA nucleotidyltransferase/poly(A) polymerase
MSIHSFRLLLHQPAVRALIAAAATTTTAEEPVELHLVGGVLRDRALGLPVHDFDAVVSGRGKEISERLSETLPARLVLLGGKEFAAYRLVGGEDVVDIWDRAGTTLHQDLARRDFTINSFAFDLRTQEVSDPFGGLDDLNRKVLRATTPRSFTGDPLRVLRLPRLLLRLPGFKAEPDTVALARRSAPGLAGIASERVRDELLLLFDHPDAARGLALLLELDLYPGLWLGRPGEPGPPGFALSELDVLPGIIRELKNHSPSISVDARAARLASVFVNLPGDRPLEALERFQDAGYLTRALASDVARLLRLLQMPGLPGDGLGDLGRRRFLHQAGALWATATCFLAAHTAARGRRWRHALPHLAELARREGETLFEPPRLVDGAEVQALLGIPPGPEVGRALQAVREAQVDGDVKTRDEAISLLRNARAAGTV